MIYKGSRYNIVYRMENRGQWLVTDILAEGVSLVANYRAQFDELFKKGGAAAVLDSLEESVARIS
jgi:phospholipid transport system substrate-binding protein